MKNEYEVWRDAKGVTKLPDGSVVRHFSDLEVVYTPNGYRYQRWRSDEYTSKHPGGWLLTSLFLMWLGSKALNWMAENFF